MLAGGVGEVMCASWRGGGGRVLCGAGCRCWGGGGSVLAVTYIDSNTGLRLAGRIQFNWFRIGGIYTFEFGGNYTV